MAEREDVTDSNETYLVWSNEHRGWWKSGGWGYDAGLEQAGHFSRQRAMQICRDALPTAAHLGTIAEIPVRLADLEFLDGQAIPACVMRSERSLP